MRHLRRDASPSGEEINVSTPLDMIGLISSKDVTLLDMIYLSLLVIIFINRII